MTRQEGLFYHQNADKIIRGPGTGGQMGPGGKCSELLSSVFVTLQLSNAFAPSYVSVTVFWVFSPCSRAVWVFGTTFPF